MFTPEGDVETNAVSFANKWKTKEGCANENAETAAETAVVRPCDENVQRKRSAETFCGNITGGLFSECHGQVDPVPYYDDCLYDVCSCRPGQFSRCYCQILAAYALECSRQNVIIDWRRATRECGTYRGGVARVIFSGCNDGIYWADSHITSSHTDVGVDVGFVPFNVTFGYS